jgi:hypothetical protein
MLVGKCEQLEVAAGELLLLLLALLLLFLAFFGISMTVWYLGISAGPTCLYLSWASSSDSRLGRFEPAFVVAPPPHTEIGR